MKKVLSVLVALFLFGSLNAQTPLLQEDFSGGSIPSTWTMHNDGKTVHSNISNYFPTAWAVVNGAAAAPSWFTSAGAADRWLITPAVTISGDNPALRFVMQSQDPNYLESLNVKISTTDTEKESFTVTALAVPNVPGRPDWTSYIVPLNEYVGQTIHIAFQLVSNDAFWLNLDDVYVGEVAHNGATLISMSTPTYGTPSEAINVEITIRNVGTDAITSFSATYTVDGTTSEAYNATDVNIAPGATYTFTHPAAYTPTTTGVNTFTAAVTAINGTDIAATGDVTSSTTVYTASDVVARMNILEQFTGENCGVCPTGGQILKQALSSRNDVIWLAHHAGFGDDPYTCAASKVLTFFYNAGGSTYAPAMMVNRAHVTDDPGPITSVVYGNTMGECTAYVTSVINAAAEVPSFGSVAFENLAYDEATRSITGTVNMHVAPAFIPASPKLSVFFSEDSILSYNQVNANGAYYHMNTARASLTANFGDAVTFDANGNATYTINYTVPQNFNASQATLVAILANHNANDPNDCVVINAAESNYLSNGVSISQASNIEMSIFPNPATEVVNIVAEESINSVRVMNTLGQVVYTNNNVNAESLQLNVNDYAAGMYIITVNTDKGTSTQRVSVR